MINIKQVLDTLFIKTTESKNLALWDTRTGLLNSFIQVENLARASGNGTASIFSPSLYSAIPLKDMKVVAEAEWLISSSGSTYWLNCLSPQLAAAICVIDDNHLSKHKLRPVVPRSKQMNV